MRTFVEVLLLCLVCAGYGKTVVDPELYNDFWEELSPDFIEKLQQTLSNYPSYEEYDWSENDDEEDPAELQEVPDWPSAKASGVIGQVGGVAVDTDDNVVVFHRAERRWDRWSFGPLNKFDPALGPIQKDVIAKINSQTGEIISSSGAGQYYMPHGATVDKDGNLWLTDVGLHQVFKIPKDPNTPGLTLGEKLEPGNDNRHFCKPTDVAVASNGDFFVADGYCNSRIMKFSGNGTLITQWGQPATGMYPGNYEFHIPHSLALDESRDLLCVADREDGRIQCFDAGLNGTRAGAFRHSFEPGRGTIYAIEFDTTGNNLYVVNGPGIGIIEGFTLDPKGNILETWGPNNQDFPSQPHDVTVSRDGRTIYVGDIGHPAKVWKFARQASTPSMVGK